MNRNLFFQNPWRLLAIFLAALISLSWQPASIKPVLAASDAVQAADSAATLPGRLKFEPFPLDSDISVISLFQDRQGFLWFGAEDGLYRYDGSAYKLYRPDPQVAPRSNRNSVRAIYEDRLGRLWVATGNGLGWFDRTTEQWTWSQPDSQVNLSASVETEFAEDSFGNLWIATGSDGLVRLEPESGQIDIFQHSSNDPGSLSDDVVTALTAGKNGELWIGTLQGKLDRLDPASGRFSHYDPAQVLPEGEPGRMIGAILEDQDGTLWLGVQGGLLRFDPQTGSFTFYAHDPVENDADTVSSMVQDAAGHLWMGTYGAGLYLFSPQAEQWAHYQYDPNDAYSLSQDEITGLVLDHTGILWIRNIFGQVDRFDPKAGFRIYREVRGNPNSLSGDTVSSISVDPQGHWWIASRYAGLNRFDPQTGLWTHYRHDPSQPDGLNDDLVSAVAADQAGRIWVGTVYGGLNRFDPQTGQWTTYPSGASTPDSTSSAFIHTLLVGSDGNIWIGTNGGILDRLDSETGQFDHFSPPGLDDPRYPDKGISALVEAPDGRLWVGTNSGMLYQLDPRSQDWKSHPVVYGSQDQLLAPITSLSVDQGGVVWISTLRAGLFRFEPESQQFTRYSVENGLPGDDVFGVLEDHRGTLWFSTAKGLSRFDSQSGSVQNFGLSDGLPGEVFFQGAAYQSQSGEMFFGSETGLVVFYPEQVSLNLHVPPIAITDFQLFYEPVIPGPDSPWKITSGGSEIQLNYSQNVFTIAYAALDFANPQENQYAYRLEGFDKDWVDAGNQRQASYTNLSPGEYIFRVKGSNNAGVWNEEGDSVRVVIQPPYWATGWFRLLSAGLLVGLVASGVGLRLRAINAQKLQLQRQVDERTRELQQALQELAESREAAERAAVYEERQRLARELHDSVTQLLYGQVLTADISHKLLKKGNLDTLEENLLKLRQIAGQSLKEMRLLLYELRPSVFEEEGLVNALELRLDSVERRSRIESYLEVKGKVELPTPIAWEMYRIAMEALNNSLKHAAATRVVIRLRSMDGKIELEVEDNGQGFDIESIDRGGLGMRSMRQRASRIGGQLDIRSKPGEGTCVRVQVDLIGIDKI